MMNRRCNGGNVNSHWWEETGSLKDLCKGKRICGCAWKGFFLSDSNFIVDQWYLQPPRRRCTYDSSIRMHQKSSLLISVFFVLLGISGGCAYPLVRAGEGTKIKKCCPVGHILDEDFQCVEVFLNFDEILWTNESDGRFRSMDYISLTTYGCSLVNESAENSASHPSKFLTAEQHCIDLARNGTKITVRCSSLKFLDNSSERTSDDEGRNHQWDFNGAVFWGASSYQATNLAHIILCIAVVTIYMALPDLGKGVYNRAVFRHNVCLLANGSIIFFLGYYECPMNDNVAIFVWLCLQYFTVATVFWLNVICFDMTLAITRFRWMLGIRDDREERRKLFLYGVFAWLGPLLPTGMAGLMDYYPGIPEDFPLKPNYPRYRSGAHPVVNLYFFVIPLFTLFCNNVLFVFTTYKILRIRSSTKIATNGRQRTTLRKKYFLFLRLYLLMGAPWFFGLLFACLNKLALLKICRLIQPILWLLMLLAHKGVRLKVVAKLRNLGSTKDRQKIDVAIHENGNTTIGNRVQLSVISDLYAREILPP